MKRFRKSVRALFGFDRRERRGTYVLSVMLIVFLLVRSFALRPSKMPEELPPLPISVNNREAETVNAKVEAASARLYVFDPNTASPEDLQSLGLTERQARTLVNYRNSGARFRKPEDIGRVYGIDSETVAVLIPYIHIRDEYPAIGKSVRSGRSPSGPGGIADARTSDSVFGLTTPRAGPAPPEAIDLNACTAEDLVTLPGIGPALSVRIIRYRNLLGGFVDSSQLNEVYGLDSSVVRAVGRHLMLTYDSIRPLELDSATFGDLARHPYLGYDAARKISRYRSVTSSPVTLGEMVVRGVITPQQAERIAPYVRPARGASGSDYEFILSKVLK